MIKYEPLAGEHIKTACEGALLLAIQNKENVGFRFNDIMIVANPSESTIQTMIYDYDSKCQQRREEYLQSDEYANYCKVRDEELKFQQSRMDYLYEEFRNETFQFYSEESTLSWLKSWIELQDHVDINGYHDKIIQYFINEGHTANQCTNLEPEKYENSNIRMRYVIGQVINLYQKTGSVHPQLSKMC